jgi:hypothetical protein
MPKQLTNPISDKITVRCNLEALNEFQRKQAEQMAKNDVVTDED